MTVNKVPATEALLAENPAFARPPQRFSAVELLLAEQYVTAHDLAVWDGATEVPADVFVWDGTTEIAAGVGVA